MTWRSVLHSHRSSAIIAIARSVRWLTKPPRVARIVNFTIRPDPGLLRFILVFCFISGKETSTFFFFTISEFILVCVFLFYLAEADFFLLIRMYIKRKEFLTLSKWFLNIFGKKKSICFGIVSKNKRKETAVERKRKSKINFLYLKRL